MRELEHATPRVFIKVAIELGTGFHGRTLIRFPFAAVVLVLLLVLGVLGDQEELLLDRAVRLIQPGSALPAGETAPVPAQATAAPARWRGRWPKYPGRLDRSPGMRQDADVLTRRPHRRASRSRGGRVATQSIARLIFSFSCSLVHGLLSSCSHSRAIPALPGALGHAQALGREPVGQPVEAVLLEPVRDAVLEVMLGLQQLVVVIPAGASG